MYRTSHRFRRRNFPPSYTEMLERQHAQLVSCVQELCQRARNSGSWDEPLPENSNRYPSVHDILAALDLLEPKDDGSRDFETFNELVGSSQSDSDAPTPAANGLSDSQDHHGSTPDQSQSPSQPSEDDTPFFPGTPTLEPDSTIPSRPPTSPDQSMELSPALSDHTTAARPTISRAPYSRSLAEYTSSQARLFATFVNSSPEPSVLQRLKRPHPIRHTNNNGNTAFFPLLGPASHAARLHTTLPPTIHDCVFGNSSLLPRLDEERYHD
jgi:hypothetical protein